MGDSKRFSRRRVDTNRRVDSVGVVFGRKGCGVSEARDTEMSGSERATRVACGLLARCGLGTECLSRNRFALWS